jgi:hypothetical protein
VIRSSIASGIDGSLMPAWAQTNGGPLSETDIDDLVAYLLTLPSANLPAPTPVEPAGGNAWLMGWGGLFTALVLFALVIALILAAQRKRKS